MSLFDQASLIVTPNAYKEGKIFAIKPTNGSGDLSVVRATTATNVNSARLIEDTPYNLLQRSEEFSNAVWTKNFSTISANTNIAPNGNLTADTYTANGTSNVHNLFQSFGFTSGVSYTFSLFVKKNTNNFIQLASSSTGLGNSFFANFDIENGVVGTFGAGTTNVNIQNYGNGWYLVSATGVALSSTSQPVVVVIVDSINAPRNQTNSLSTSILIWGAQLVSGSLARVYFSTTDRLNVPRLDYTNSTCPSILVEPQRTNLVLRSEEFENANWLKLNSNITTNSTTSPSGIINADTFNADGTLSAHAINQTNTVISGTSYTLSIYAKKNTNNFIQISGGIVTFGLNVWANFDLNTGVVGSIGSSTTASIQNFGNGWYRCNITGTAIASISSASQIISVITSATSVRNETNTLSTSVFIWGAQLEVGSYATSYIPTVASTVTRNADTTTRGSIFTNGLVTSSGGTWFLDLKNNRALVRDNASSAMFINTGTSASLGDGFRIRNTGTSRLVIDKIVSSVASTGYSTTTDDVKIAIRWNGITADYFVNGVKVVSNTAFTATAIENFNISCQVPYYIKSVMLFPTPITDTQAIQLTTL